MTNRSAGIASGPLRFGEQGVEGFREFGFEADTDTGLTDIAAPGQPTRDTILQVDEKQSTRTEFSDLYGGLYSGIAWNW